MAKLKSPKMFSFMLNEYQKKNLDAISEITMIPLSALVRQGIDMVIQKYQGEQMKSRKKGGGG